jgi:hypothetical protein
MCRFISLVQTNKLTVTPKNISYTTTILRPFLNFQFFRKAYFDIRKVKQIKHSSNDLHIMCDIGWLFSIYHHISSTWLTKPISANLCRLYVPLSMCKLLSLFI